MSTSRLTSEVELPDPRLGPFDYDLPAGAVALFPPVDRDGGRMLVLTSDGARRDCLIVDLPDDLRKGDLVVVNDTAVVKARLFGRRATGGQVELLLLPSAGAPLAMVRPGRRLRVGEAITVLDAHGEEAGQVTLVGPQADGSWEVGLPCSADVLMARAGQVPLPPYLGRPPVPEDAERYQTVYARQPGAVAAPTAGLHLSRDVLAALGNAGIAIANVTLHVGAGTFRNLRPADLDAGRLHTEAYDIPAETAAAIGACRARGGRIIAVGTTVARVLETAHNGERGVRAGAGTTDIFLRPGHRFEVVDGLLTNLHLPMSSLLMLVCAFGGTAAVMDAYRHCAQAGYRFFSYGDAMLLLPQASR
jgi:S-adenosylmethionine:tRNA ribosyltransferase-isomerase